MTPFELNVGLAACAELSLPVRAIFDMLAQGQADHYFTRQFSRLRRSWRSDLAAEEHIYNLVTVANLAGHAVLFDGRINEDKAADLLSFIFERGMNMEASHDR